MFIIAKNNKKRKVKEFIQDLIQNENCNDKNINSSLTNELPQGYKSKLRSAVIKP